ncbi:MAG: hypothetical protein A2X08_10500 [Bacteroidetes bacterium GWA2_32_17]|nr:MAG: hypothetical protein A2X08_10500 [Bacteroidetes bacterium GWA2_32_17]
MNIAIADIHCHPILRLYNGNKDIWFSDEVDDSKRHKNFPGFAEAEFAALARSRVRLVFVSLYPVEQGFISNLAKHADIFPEKPFINKVVNEVIGYIVKTYSKNGTVIDFLEKSATHWLSSMTYEKFEDIRSCNHDYYNDLKNELDYLEKSVKKVSPQTINEKKYNLKIVSSYTELQKVLEIDDNYNYASDDDNTIAIVLTVEGGHSLGIGQENTKHLAIDQFNNINNDGSFANPEVNKLFTKVKNNITDIKKWGENGSHCPFFMTFAHHFYNQLCGHNMSFAGIAHSIFDQNNGMNTSITEFGKKIINELLSVENGRRILIDTKHMSVETKKWYYNFVREYNQKNIIGIPIISSHSAVSGNKNLSDHNSNNHLEMDDYYENGKKAFNTWDINLSDEEINLIHESEGLIGLNLDQRILSGKKMLDFLKSNINDETQKIIFQSVWAEPVLQNVLHIIEVVTNSQNRNKKYVWDMITIGSDYDGIINPLDAYCYAEDLETLRNILIQKLELQISWNPLLKDKNAAEVIDAIMFKNAVKFLKKHFKYTNNNNIV